MFWLLRVMSENHKLEWLLSACWRNDSLNSNRKTALWDDCVVKWKLRPDQTSLLMNSKDQCYIGVRDRFGSLMNSSWTVFIESHTSERTDHLINRCHPQVTFYITTNNNTDAEQWNQTLPLALCFVCYFRAVVKTFTIPGTLKARLHNNCH